MNLYTKYSIALFLSLFYFFMWWGLHTDKEKRYSFRGVGVEDSLKREKTPHEYSVHLSTFCWDLPMCFRTFSAWVMQGTYHTLAKFYIYVGNETFAANTEFARFPNLNNSALLLDVSSSTVVSFAYLFSFIFLFLFFDSFNGFWALFSFAAHPLAISAIGFVQHDPSIIFLWSLFFLTFPKLKKQYLDVNNPFKNRLAVLYFAMFGLVSTWIVENMGIAFSIALFIILGVDFLKNKKKGNIVYFFTVSFFTLFAMGISWVMTHRHEEVFWIQPGKGIEATWEIYSKEDRLLDLFRYSWYMIRVPFIVGSILFPISLFVSFLRKKNISSKLKKYRFNILMSLGGVIGFFCTCVAGLWMGAGFRYEWSRQLMPLSFLFTVFYFSFILYVSSLIIMYYKKRKWEIT